MLVFATFLLLLLLIIAPFSTPAFTTLRNAVPCRDHPREEDTPSSKFNGSKYGPFRTRLLEPLKYT